MLNSCNFIGRLGRDLEIKYTQSGEAVTTLNVACSESYKDKDGNKKEKTEWITVQVWGKKAELCSQYLAKGSLVHVEGKLSTRKWQDKNGQDRYSTEIIARQVNFLDKKGESQSKDYSDSGSPFPAQDSNDLDSIPF